MALRHLETLQLEPDRVEKAVDFFEAYASFIQSPSSGITGESALVDAASSLRAAGQWAMLINPQRAMTLFTTSARIWHRLGYGFGTYLLAAFAPDQLNRYEMINQLTALAQPYVRRQLAFTERQELPEPLLHPQQQVYLLLAEAGMSRQMELPVDVLQTFADQSPHRRGVVPIGSLGTPMRVYWDISRHLLESSDERAAVGVVRDIAGMSRSYAEKIDSAMVNQKLWFNAAAPVDVGDVDISAITMIAVRRLGFDRMRARLRSTASNLSSVARIPVELAIEMIQAYRADPESTS